MNVITTAIAQTVGRTGNVSADQVGTSSSSLWVYALSTLALLAALVAVAKFGVRGIVAVVMALAIMGLLLGCASSPPRPLEQRYVQATWAKVPVQQAAAECENDVASLRSASMYLCMKAKGYEER